ncbi:hypothetical protein XENOCAPTIV_023777, partial [Xenoophorus captivus]
DEFGYNAETQKLLCKNGEALLGAINFFVSSINTLVNKTMEDTLMTIRHYENARLEFDAYRSDLEELSLGPRDAAAVVRIEMAQQEYQIYREKYERLQNSAATDSGQYAKNSNDFGLNAELPGLSRVRKAWNIMETSDLPGRKLREMCKLLPDEAEMKQLVGFKGDPKALPEADLFMLMLIKMPRITKGDIEAEIERQKKKVQVAKADTLKQEELKAQMEDFLKEADVCLEEIESDFEELQAVSDSVSEYFCEDPTTFRLEECCSIFQSFCQKFIRAMQSAAKRRSTATCSSKDKEMEGIALEYVLQNVLTDRVSRRRSGKSSSSNGSPTGGSPVNGSLSEISSQKNFPTGTMNHRNTFRENNQFKKEWNSATELTQNFSQKQAQSHVEDNNSKNMATYEEKRKTFKREYFQDLTSQSKATPRPLPTIRSFSATSDDDKEEDLQDNNEEEAQKLREASKKVLQYQNSRGSTTSVDHSLENQKSPPARKTLARQLTFDEETQRYPGDPTNEDLIRFLIGPQSSTKRNLGRRNTLPTNVSKTQGEEENLHPHATAGSPNPLAQIKEPQSGQDVGHTPSKPAFDFTDTSNKIKQSHSLDQSSPSAEKKSKPNGSSGLLSEGGLQENQEQKSMEYTDSHQQTNVENILPRSVWFKTETTGSFFSFLRRLGDISKSPNSKETTPKGSDSSV